MCVWTKKRGSMNAVVLMATPCPKSLHGKGEKWIARNILQGLDSRQPMTAMTTHHEGPAFQSSKKGRALAVVLQTG